MNPRSNSKFGIVFLKKLKKLPACDTDFSTRQQIAKDTLERWNSLTELKKLVAS